MEKQVSLKVDQSSSFFILGSGFSKAVSNQMPVTNGISNELDASSTQGMSFLNKYYTFEDAMSYLASDHPFLDKAELYKNKGKYFELVDSVVSILKRCQEGAKNEIESNVWLQKLITKWHEFQVPIISFNYDNIVEIGAIKFLNSSVKKGENPTVYLEDFYQLPLTDVRTRSGGAFFGKEDRAETIKLFKLHGSLNWYYSGNEDFSGEQIYYTYDLLEPKSENIIDYISDLKTLLIPPIFTKNLYFNHSSLKSQWIRASLELSDSQFIFILGYSFPKEDLEFRSYLIRFLNLNAGKTSIIVVNKNAEEAMRVAKNVKESIQDLAHVFSYDYGIAEFADEFEQSEIKNIKMVGGDG